MLIKLLCAVFYLNAFTFFWPFVIMFFGVDMQFEIRKAEVKDAENIVDVNLTSWETTYGDIFKWYE